MSKRIKFFFSHLSISIFIALLIVGLIFFVWYPQPLATAVGVTQIFLMLIVIDIIIGPLIGLLVYKEGKKSLKFDLSVIILLQISALFYGLYNLEKGRPVWIAYNVDRFELIRKNEVITDHLHQASEQFQHIPWLKPQYVGVQFAQDKKQRENDMFTEILGGISIAQKPERYVDFAQSQKSIKEQAQPLALLNDFNEPDSVQKILSQYPQATAFIPLKASVLDMTVLVNKNTGDVLEIVNLRPWK